MARPIQRAARFRTAIILAIVAVLAVFAIVRLADHETGGDGPVAALAQCISDKGAKMYGAYWCPHCAAQKKLFGSAVSKLPYVECAIPGDSGGQTQICKDNNVESYPTWVFADGSRESGEQSLEELARKTGCPYADAVTPTTTADTNAASNVNASPAVNVNQSVNQ